MSTPLVVRALSNRSYLWNSVSSMLNIDTTQSVSRDRNAIAMGLFIFNGMRGLSDEEIALGTPDESEANDLKHHVARCAYRYRSFTKRQSEQGDDITKIKYMLVGLIGVLCLTSPQLRDFIAWMFGHI